MDKKLYSKSHFPEMDIMRAMAILMVLLFHSILVYPIDYTESYWSFGQLHTFLYVVEMPVFFFVSGFCFSYKKETGYINYLGKKSLRLLVPHFAFGFFDIMMRVLPTGLVNKTASPVDEVTDFLLYSSNDWFLLTLFIIFIFAPLLYFVQKSGMAGKAVVIVFALLLYLFQNRATTLFCINNVVIYTVYFVIGMVIRDVMGRKSEDRAQTSTDEIVKQGSFSRVPIKRIILFVFALILGIVGFFVNQWRGFTGQPEDWLPVFEGKQIMNIREPLTKPLVWGVTGIKFIYLLEGLITSLLLIYVVYCISLLIRDYFMVINANIFTYFINDCSKYSLQMYLLDGYALVLTRTVLVSLLGITTPFAVVPINFVADTFIVWFISKYVLAKVKLFRIASGMN